MENLRLHIVTYQKKASKKMADNNNDGADVNAAARAQTATALQSLYNLAVALPSSQNAEADRCANILAGVLGLNNTGASPEVVKEEGKSDG